MGFDYFVFYTEASVICVIILLTILITDGMYNTMQEKQVWFRRAIIAFMLYFISDACWAAMLSGVFPRVRALVVLFNYTNYILLSLMAYGLFMFMAATEKMPFRNDSVKKRLCFIPIIISILFISFAYMIAPLFWINENGELNNLYYPLMFLAPMLYLVAGFILSIIYARKAQSKAERRRCLIIGIIPVGVMAFGMLQVIALNAPTFCFGCTIMWLWYYIQNMQTMISVDDLTRLNNRGQINRYMEQIHFAPDIETFILMLDINRFKMINDTYGHAEGDRALIIVADALRQVCEGVETSAFLGRYGGDEFTIIIRSPQKNDLPEPLTQRIRTALSDKAREYQLPYNLQVSVGYDKLTDDSDTVYACLDRADKNLYIDKQRLTD